MIDLRERLPHSRVLVIGDIMLDEYLYGAVSRVSPEAPVPVVDIRSRKFVPGGAANVAANVSGLGASVRLVGGIGPDPGGELLRDALAAAGVGDSWVVRFPNRPTTRKTRVVAAQQQIVRLDTEHRQPLSDEERRLLATSFSAALAESDVCILSDYGKGALSPGFCAELIQSASREGKPVVADPKGTDLTKYRGCMLVTPNLRETAEAAGHPVETEDHLMEAGRILLDRLAGANLLVTRGPDGMTLFRPGHEPLTIPTVAREVFDVTGAGDTAIATLGVCLAAGLDLETSIRVANVAAGIVVGKHGTAAIAGEELFRHPDLAAAGIFS